MNSVNQAFSIIVIVVFLGLFGAMGYLVYDSMAQAEIEESLAVEREALKNISPDPNDWRTHFPEVETMTIGSSTIFVSVADTLATRIKGLSDTPFIPDNVVKLFVFRSPGEHSIWMKDMNYSIDIIWLEENGTIVHIEEEISPDTFPQSFASPTPAWFVLEASAGFVERYQLKLGDQLILPEV